MWVPNFRQQRNAIGIISILERHSKAHRPNETKTRNYKSEITASTDRNNISSPRP